MTPREICRQLVELQALRRGLIREQVALSNRRGSMVRRALGFRIDLPEAERERIRKAGAKLVRDLLKGEVDERQAPLGIAWVVQAMELMIAPGDAVRDRIERRMRELAEQLPVWPWAEAVRGFGALGLAVIVGETGEGGYVGDYRTVSGFWKRLGYAVVNGVRQQKRKDKDEAIAHGYSPSRHAECWAFLQDVMLRAQWRAGSEDEPGKPLGPYGAIYSAAKLKYAGRIDEKGKPWTPAHADRAARRVMAKAFLADLYGAWRAADRDMAGSSIIEAHAEAAGREATSMSAEPVINSSPPTNSKRAKAKTTPNQTTPAASSRSVEGLSRPGTRSADRDEAIIPKRARLTSKPNTGTPAASSQARHPSDGLQVSRARRGRGNQSQGGQKPDDLPPDAAAKDRRRASVEAKSRSSTRGGGSSSQGGQRGNEPQAVDAAKGVRRRASPIAQPKVKTRGGGRVSP